MSDTMLEVTWTLNGTSPRICYILSAVETLNREFKFDPSVFDVEDAGCYSTMTSEAIHLALVLWLNRAHWVPL